MNPGHIIAVVFDFDDTLTDDSTSQLLRNYGVDPDSIWQRAGHMVQQEGWDPTLAYLHLLVEQTRPGEPMDGLKVSDLVDFGKSLQFYKGIPEVFGELTAIVSTYEYAKPAIEFYVISGGLADVIRGSSIAPLMTGIWGCEFAADNDGRIQAIRRAVTFTEKTRHIYEISKGILPPRDGGKAKHGPYAVNMEMPTRRVPLNRMIYVGDGLTDVPCFSLVKKTGAGLAFGVFDPSRKSGKKAYQELLAQQRVISLNKPLFTKDDELGSILRSAVASIAENISLSSVSAV